MATTTLLYHSRPLPSRKPRRKKPSPKPLLLPPPPTCATPSTSFLHPSLLPLGPGPSAAPLPPHQMGLLYREPRTQDPPSHGEILPLLPLGRVPPRIQARPLHLYHHARHLRRGGADRVRAGRVGGDGGAGIAPDAAAFTSMMHWLAKAGDLDGAVRAWGEMRRRRGAECRPRPTCHTYTVLMEYLAGAGKFEAALQIMDEMQEAGIQPDKAACNILVQKCSKAGETSAMNQVLQYMKEHFIVLRRIDNDIDINNSNSYSIIDRLTQDSCTNNRPSCALAVFQYCLRMRKELAASAYACLLGFFVRNSSFHTVLEIVEEMSKAGHNLGVYLTSVLIYKLGCAGLSSYAERVFNSFLMEHNVVTYTALMDAYFRAGKVDKGVELYSRMKSQGISLSSGSYVVLINGLEKAGRIHDAEICRKEKRRLEWKDRSQEEIVPDEILCNCLFGGDNG
uniref:Pentatricopeptide repeat-containing protein n=1 Tax=Ananas comosus var. bracteatus TaxID=296719 RepID=A0A6V7Q3L0_ANACO|nr:unnamed protein product [Ananas comosus var. bracteatus]